ncbi:hypothetical protein AgCh_009936 [Apium graveolens]
MTKRRPSRLPKIQYNGNGVAPTMKPMGEVDGGTSVKRRKGRPPKLHAVVVEAESMHWGGLCAGEEAFFVCRSGELPKVNTGMVRLGEGWYNVSFNGQKQWCGQGTWKAT